MENVETVLLVMLLSAVGLNGVLAVKVIQKALKGDAKWNTLNLFY